MDDLIINCETQKKEIVKKNPQQEATRQAEIAEAEEEAAIEAAEAKKKADALKRLKASANADTLDLLKFLGLG